MTSIQSQCHTCIHLRRDGGKCAAFPDGIPSEIILNQHDHREPYPGDNGIQYEPIDEDTANGINNDNGNG